MQNCWEFKKCGREPGGDKVESLGVCPAATETRVHSMNRGQNGGRTCWAITGTLCGGQVQGSFATKLGNCLQCDFYKAVQQEEGKNYESTKFIMAKLQ